MDGPADFLGLVLLQALGACHLVHGKHFLEKRVRVLRPVAHLGLCPARPGPEAANQHEIHRKQDCIDQQHQRHPAQRHNQHKKQVLREKHDVKRVLIEQHLHKLDIRNQFGQKPARRRFFMKAQGEKLKLLDNCHFKSALHRSCKAVIHPVVKGGADQVDRQGQHRKQQISSDLRREEGMRIAEGLDDIRGKDRQEQRRQMAHKAKQRACRRHVRVFARKEAQKAKRALFPVVFRFVIVQDLVGNPSAVLLSGIDGIDILVPTITVVDIPVKFAQDIPVDFDLGLFRVSARPLAGLVRKKRIRLPRGGQHHRPAAKVSHADTDSGIAGSEQMHQQLLAQQPAQCFFFRSAGSGTGFLLNHLQGRRKIRQLIYRYAGLYHKAPLPPQNHNYTILL